MDREEYLRSSSVASDWYVLVWWHNTPFNFASHSTFNHQPTENIYELEHIRKGIAQCVKHDPPKALEVICDHAVIPSQPSESYNPELRDLVVDYMTSPEIIDASVELFRTPEGTAALGDSLAKVRNFYHNWVSTPWIETHCSLCSFCKRPMLERLRTSFPTSFDPAFPPSLLLRSLR